MDKSRVNHGPPRRQVVLGAAWTVPVVAVAAPVSAFATSPRDCYSQNFDSQTGSITGKTYTTTADPGIPAGTAPTFTIARNQVSGTSLTNNGTFNTGRIYLTQQGTSAGRALQTLVFTVSAPITSVSFSVSDWTRQQRGSGPTVQYTDTLSFSMTPRITTTDSPTRLDTSGGEYYPKANSGYNIINGAVVTLSGAPFTTFTITYASQPGTSGPYQQAAQLIFLDNFRFCF